MVHYVCIVYNIMDMYIACMCDDDLCQKLKLFCVIRGTEFSEEIVC